MEQTNYLEISTEGRILIFTINNPPHNYLPGAIFKEFESCRELMLSSDADAIIFTGKGNVFSKGADIEEIKSDNRKPDRETLRFGNEMLSFISRLHKPVIAAINGPCMGAGLELALACHVRLCSEKARLGLPEVSMGIIPGLGGIQRLIRVVGEARAMEMILLGDIISASRALELNLVSRVLPKTDFFPRVLFFVKTILAVPGEALKEALRLVAMARPENEDNNIIRAAETFARMISGRKG
ncbi:MAG: enoyl-CoA hydratase/isomerase family protein [Thermodesulfobacteriota bacterium]|nr:enoyl-CoA hydratase/isomerase family protein [Thermodesulfobacteriota bacterium]